MINIIKELSRRSGDRAKNITWYETRQAHESAIPPGHVNCRCVVVPGALPEPLPGEDVLTQAERVVVEYEAARASGSCSYRRGG